LVSGRLEILSAPYKLKHRPLGEGSDKQWQRNNLPPLRIIEPYYKLDVRYVISAREGKRLARMLEVISKS
jgi:hypothetical protein